MTTSEFCAAVLAWAWIAGCAACKGSTHPLDPFWWLTR